MRHTFESVESSQKASSSGKKAIQDADDEPAIDGSMTIGEALNGLAKSGSGAALRQTKGKQADDVDDEDEYIVRTDHLAKPSAE